MDISHGKTDEKLPCVNHCKQKYQTYIELKSRNCQVSEMVKLGEDLGSDRNTDRKHSNTIISNNLGGKIHLKICKKIFIIYLILLKIIYFKYIYFNLYNAYLCLC